MDEVIMRKYLPIIFVLMLPTLVFCGGHTRISIAPDFNYGFGNTNYFMDHYVGDTTIEDAFGNPIVIEGLRAKSELVFPLGGILIGGRVAITGYDSVKENWSLELSGYTNIGQPTGKMKDSDWIGAKGYIDSKISYTESDVEGDNLILSIEARKRISGQGRSLLFLRAGFRYQKINQKIINVSGWQYNELGDIVDVYYNGHALDYWIKYHTPYIGFRFKRILSAHAQFLFSTSYMLSFIKDYDNHILRFKEAASDDLGHGFDAIATLRLLPGTTAEESGRLFIDFEAKALHAKISTSQTQHWYGDDPASTDNDTGLTIENIHHLVETRQYGLFFRIGLMF